MWLQETVALIPGGLVRIRNVEENKEKIERFK